MESTVRCPSPVGCLAIRGRSQALTLLWPYLTTRVWKWSGPDLPGNGIGRKYMGSRIFVGIVNGAVSEVVKDDSYASKVERKESVSSGSSILSDGFIRLED